MQIYKIIILQNKPYTFVNIIMTTHVNNCKIPYFKYLSIGLNNLCINLIYNKIHIHYLAKSNTYNIILHLISNYCEFTLIKLM